MKRTTVLLLCAVAFVNAGPYSKIPETYSQTHANLNDGLFDQATEHDATFDGSFGAKATSHASSSASGSSSGAYSSSSANANAEANANANAGHNQGSNVNSNVDQTVQSGFDSLPQGFMTGHYRPSNVGQTSQTSQTAQDQSGKAGLQYWWMGDDSPFGPNGKPSGGCSSTGCSASGTFDLNKGSGAAHGSNQIGQVGVELHRNPFLQGGLSFNSESFQAGNTFQHSGTNGHQGTDNINSTPGSSKNPFFNNIPSTGSSASSSASASANANANTYVEPSKNTVGGGNPFFNSGSGFKNPVVVLPPQPSQQPPNQQFPQFPSQDHHDEQSYDQYEQSQVDQSSSGFDSGLSVSCSGHGKICVAKHLCNNGFVSNNIQGLTQVRSSNQQCDINREVCCTLSNNYQAASADQSQAGSGSGFGSVHVPENNGIISHSSNGLFGNSKAQNNIDLNAGDQNVPTTGDSASNGYLPPLGSQPSDNVPLFLNPPQEPKEPEIIPSPSGPAPTHVQLGCAAALVCVEEQYCGMDGMMSPNAISLSSEQLLRRVPLSDCKNPDNGVIGKCCRDPNYVDPWPTGNLPANYDGGFDEQGFPTFLNIQKNRPPQKKPLGPVKGGSSGVKTGPRPTQPPIRQNFPTQQPIRQNFPTQQPIRQNFPTQTQSPIRQSFPTQQPIRQNFPTQQPIRQVSSTQPPQFTTSFVQNNQGFNNNFSGKQKPFVQPTPTNLQSFVSTTNKPQQTFPSFPSSPSFPNPFNKPIVDESSSTNLKLTVIAPHTPGSQCGVRNSVQRANGLSDVDVAFGEIPWQVMILSNQEKKLLCSGALIAPNAVMTAARCVDGYQPSDVSIKVGEWKLGWELEQEEPLPFEIVSVQTIVQHPGYQAKYPSHDVAILLLEHPVALDQHVDTICLSQESTPRPGMKCISTGWGKVILQSHLAGALMHSIDVDVLSQNECLQRLQGAENQLDIDDSLVCTKAHKQNNNMCQVDLGGPLACDRGDGNYAIMGVYNQDTGCSPINQVTTFATIDQSWVKQTLSSLPQKTSQIYTDFQTPQKTIIQTPSQPQYHKHTPDQPCDCQKSNFPSENNQYLPPL